MELLCRADQTLGTQKGFHYSSLSRLLQLCTMISDGKLQSSNFGLRQEVRRETMFYLKLPTHACDLLPLLSVVLWLLQKWINTYLPSLC